MGAMIDRVSRIISAMTPRFEDAHVSVNGQMQRIVSRTQMGLDAKGEPFQAKKDGSMSTLRKTGQLQSSFRMRVDVVGGVPRAEIYVAGPAAKYAPYVNKVRPFMAISDSDRHRMRADFANSIMNRIRRAY